MDHKNTRLKENRILAAFISNLPEAILVCDVNGMILLHDSQAETYLLPGNSKPGGAVSLAGKSITSLVDKHLVEYALDEINAQLKQDATHTVSTFILQKPPRILQAQVVPVLSAAGLFTGFVLILDDITQQSQAEKRVEALLNTLSKNARSPLASIRAAIEAMRAFPRMDEQHQNQFKEIIYTESIILSDILNNLSDEYTSLIHAKKTLTTLLVRDFMQTVARRAQEKLGIRCHMKPRLNAEHIKINADPYTFINTVLFILDRLKTETGLTEFYYRFYKNNALVLIDISWKGDPIPPRVIKQWETLDIGTQNIVSNLTLKEALNHHQSALWTYTGQNTEGKDLPCLRFFIPMDDRPVKTRLEHDLALPESRIQMRDIEIFDHSDQSQELDNRLLTELSYTALIREINQARRVEDIIGKHSQLPRLIHSMLTSGTKIKTVTWLVTAFSDAILNKLLTFAATDLGPPPVPFAFVTLGSEGRKEQTLKTDQDNAIVFQDPEEGQTMETLQPYFLELGKKVCTWLDQSGFDFCQGGIMAKNPKWCQPLSVWKGYFSDWIHAASPEDLLYTSIFFDFRFAYGDNRITENLFSHLVKTLSNWTGFFRNMAENAVYFKPPIGVFGNLIVRSTPPHKRCIDIKMANTPIVDYARIYSLKHQIRETATQDRLYHLYLKKILSRNAYNELEQAYCFNMQIRFMAQIQAILGQNLPPHNYINPKDLSSIEKKLLKEVLKKIKTLQAKLRFDFIGDSEHPIS